MVDIGNPNLQRFSQDEVMNFDIVVLVVINTYIWIKSKRAGRYVIIKTNNNSFNQQKYAQFGSRKVD